MAEASQRGSDTAPERDRSRADDVIDTTVMEWIVARRPDGLEALYDRFARPAYSLARRICVDEALAEDVVQEAFLVIWRHPDRFDPARGSVSSWLLTLVHHRAVDAVRREATRRKRTAGPPDEGEEWIAPEPGAEAQALDAVVAGHVREALAQLPPEQREALALAYFGGYTQREIASLVGIPLGTVKSRMFTGVRTLRALLAPQLADEPEGEA